MNPLIDRLPSCRTLKFPGFVTGWMIADIVLTSLRLLSCALVPFLICMAPEELSFYLALASLACSLLLFLFGLPAAIGLLCKKRWALGFGKVTIAANLLSLILMLGLILLMIPQFLTSEPNALMIFILWISAAVPCFCARIVFLVFYWIAIIRAGRFFRDRGF